MQKRSTLVVMTILTALSSHGSLARFENELFYGGTVIALKSPLLVFGPRVTLAAERVSGGSLCNKFWSRA